MSSARHERRQAQARKALGPRVAAHAWEAGRTVGPHELAAAALSESRLRETIAPITQADPLTPRERDVVTLLARGDSNREIAAALIIGERTVEMHVGHVLAKLGLSSRTQIAVWAVEHAGVSGR